MGSKNSLPLFKELSDAGLRTEYAGYRNLAYNNARIGTPAAARQMGTLMKAIQIIEGLARKRGISLVGGLLLAIAACASGCAHGPAPAPEVENVGNLSASYHSIAVAPVHHDAPPELGTIVDTGSDDATDVVATTTRAPQADAGSDAELPEMTAKASHGF